VNLEHGRGIVIPLIFFSDKTLLSKDAKISGHPIYMTIANIACEDRHLPEGHCFLALLPDFKVTGSTSLQRMQAFQNCLSHVLKSLKECSYK
jgi:hypothetical protein